jgi:serine/threonine protein kinase
MAEVYKARRDGPGGFVKDLALKKILPQYSRNKGLVQRFMEEARVAGALTHGNVIQVYDFGQVEDIYYLVMEYIDGVSLAILLDRCAAVEVPLPSPLVAYIGAEACSGLAYAHNLTDKNGRRVEVVHRDVSPQNILLSFVGDVKISDFGIAKAADSMIRTEVGLRLGKASYMSPEQAAGATLDGRSDLFALGVTLWEALTLKPLLPRGDAARILEALSTCDFPLPSSIRRDVPPELEEIVMQSLAHDREDRFSDGETMARALRAFVHTAAPGFGRHDLVEYLDWLHPNASRPSGLGPPQPPQLVHTARYQPTRQPQKAPIWPWLVLATAPILGLMMGGAAFLGLLFFTAKDEGPPPVELIEPLPSAQPVPIAPGGMYPNAAAGPQSSFGTPPPVVTQPPIAPGMVTPDNLDPSTQPQQQPPAFELPAEITQDEGPSRPRRNPRRNDTASDDKPPRGRPTNNQEDVAF